MAFWNRMKADSRREEIEDLLDQQQAIVDGKWPRNSNDLLRRGGREEERILRSQSHPP